MPTTHTAQTLRSVPGPGQLQDRIASSVTALADILGISHGELARAAEIHPSALSRALGQKRKLSVDEMDRLASALDVPSSVLFDGGEEIRRRARLGVLSQPPETGPGQEIQQSRGIDERPGQRLAPVVHLPLARAS
jgi:transcriptional regulator with XRE-family HTH domain